MTTLKDLNVFEGLDTTAVNAELTDLFTPDRSMTTRGEAAYKALFDYAYAAVKELRENDVRRARLVGLMSLNPCGAITGNANDVGYLWFQVLKDVDDAFFDTDIDWGLGTPDH